MNPLTNSITKTLAKTLALPVALFLSACTTDSSSNGGGTSPIVTPPKPPVPFSVKLTAPTASYLTTNAAGEIVFSLESTGELATGETNFLAFTINKAELFKTNLSAISLVNGKWSYSHRAAGYDSVAEGPQSWQFVYSNTKGITTAVTNSGGFGFRYPPQRVTEISAVTLQTNAKGTPAEVRISWTEPALQVTNSGYQVFWGPAGSVKDIGSNLAAGKSNVVVVGDPTADYAYRIVTTNALSTVDTNTAAASATVSYLVFSSDLAYRLSGPIQLEYDKNFHGASTPVTLKWSASGTHEAQQVWWGDTAGSLTQVTNVEAEVRSVTLSSNRVGTVAGSKTVYFKLRATKGSQTPINTAEQSAALESCAANQGDYVMVCSRLSLENINGKGLAGKYRLQNDLDLGGKTYTNALIAPDTVDDDDNSFDGTPFTGEFDGANRRIVNGIIDGGGSKDFLGLIGRNGFRGMVKHLGVSLRVVNGDESVGGLVGDNNPGTLSNVYATGAVSGKYQVGGLVGINYGTITKAYATGIVSGNNTIGGLVGRYAYGNSISDSYATGAVSGEVSVGGLIGNGGAGVLKRVYATGSITRTSGTGTSFGRVLGVDVVDTKSGLYHSSNTIDWNGAAAGTGNAPTDSWKDPGTPTAVDFSTLTAANVAGKFTGFNFTSVWKWSPTLRRPVLRNMPAGAEGFGE